MDVGELVQITERALFDAEQAYRIDPSEANQRRMMKAWAAVRDARALQREQQTDATTPPAPPEQHR